MTPRTDHRLIAPWLDHFGDADLLEMRDFIRATLESRGPSVIGGIEVAIS